jgi:hypothetical protein
MSAKTKKILGWALSGLAGLMLIASAIDKIIPTQHAIDMASSFGISTNQYIILGIIEVTSVLLFLYPRTAILGLLLLSSYLGGAIATHLQHGQEILFPSVFEAVFWIAAVIRFPELTQRILSNTFRK